MEEKLFISFQRGYIKRDGTPLTDDIVLFDSYDASKKTKFFSSSEWRTLDYKDIAFPPVEEKYRLPRNLFLVFKKKTKNIDFHYLDMDLMSKSYHNIFLIF